MTRNQAGRSRWWCVVYSRCFFLLFNSWWGQKLAQLVCTRRPPFLYFCIIYLLENEMERNKMVMIRYSIRGKKCPCMQPRQILTTDEPRPKLLSYIYKYIYSPTSVAADGSWRRDTAVIAIDSNY
jgi:hypothetical protein